MFADISAASNTIGVRGFDLVAMHAGLKPSLIFDRMMGFVPEKPVIDWISLGSFLSRTSVYGIIDSRYDTSTDSIKTANQVYSIATSSIESKIFEDFFSIPGQSTISVIQAAGDLGLTIINNTAVNSSNISSVLAQSSGYSSGWAASVQTFIQELGLPSASEEGAQLVLPQRPVTIAGNTYEVAYYFRKQNRVAAALLGVANGGRGGVPASDTPTGFSPSLITPGLADLLPTPGSTESGNFRDLLSSDLNLQQIIFNGVGVSSNCAGMPVNFNNGSMWHRFDDIAPMSDVGPALTFSRIYQSQSSENGALGYGWNHNYGMRLQTSDGTPLDFYSTQNLIYVDENNNRNPISFKNGVAVLDPSQKLTFSKNLSSYLLTDKNKIVYRFNGTGPDQPGVLLPLTLLTILSQSA
jgi:hypothetical protein